MSSVILEPDPSEHLLDLPIVLHTARDWARFGLFI